MKNFLFLAFIGVFFLFSKGEIFANGDLPTANFSWDANSYENITKYEFILDLKDSVLEQTLKRDKSRIKKNGDIYNVTNVNEFEEKIVLRLTGKNNQYIDFVNFDYKNTKKFHNISLIEENGKLKAKVTIYFGEVLNYDVYSILQNGLKSAQYLYLGMKSGKPYKKARTIKIK